MLRAANQREGWSPGEGLQAASRSLPAARRGAGAPPTRPRPGRAEALEPDRSRSSPASATGARGSRSASRSKPALERSTRCGGGWQHRAGQKVTRPGGDADLEGARRRVRRRGNVWSARARASRRAGCGGWSTRRFLAELGIEIVSTVPSGGGPTSRAPRRARGPGRRDASPGVASTGRRRQDGQRSTLCAGRGDTCGVFEVSQYGCPPGLGSQGHFDASSTDGSTGGSGSISP